ncbi:hypothetical protein [Dyella telluris]|uniref:Uncharacterized protein n=1 Tax=Dyella telluris TaxID=2763498 RepID=A0A7G8Q4Q0_9GAMM|nr:hypothetical protein [Dyella telluris]QNK01758.1 hypothetical protein H8F01_00830 [Dyella telluris]
MKAKRAILWFLLNGAFAAAMVAGYTYDIEGARYLFKFYFWVTVILTLFVFVPEIKVAMAKQGPSVPEWMNVVYDLSICSFLAWYGHPVMAAAYFFHMFCQHSAYAHKPAQEAV